MPSAFPQGRYLSATGVARLNSGGQTRALLLRSRLLSEATGTTVDVLCFDPSRSYDQVRADWRRSGQLSDGLRLLNLYEHYRELGWGEEQGTGEALPALRQLDAVDKRHPDGSPWQTSYRDPATGLAVLNDFRRADGSVYLRSAPYRTVSDRTLPTELIRVSPAGEVLGRFSSLTEWYHRWLRELTVADERVFLFMDSRYLVPIFAPVRDPGTSLIYVLHNCHLPAPRHWNTPPTQDYRRCLERIGDVDAFVTLTARQRRDIELAWGARSNLDVVPNPVEAPAPPVPVPARDPHRVVLLARLERQKRVQDAIRVMELVVDRIPEARLDVYGAGRKQEQLQLLVDELGLTGRVVLHGHDPQARDQLWHASAFLLTSEFEGYPLSTLESLSRGCPVVAYDVPYGPQEQVVDGVNGFLIAAGDLQGAAARVVQLLSDPELVAGMGAAGRETARRHGTQAFVADWARVLESVVERSPRRHRLTSVQHRVRLLRSPGLTELVLEGEIEVSTDNTGADSSRAVVTVDVLDEPSGRTVSLPVVTERNHLGFAFQARMDLSQIFSTLPVRARPVIRLRLTWENACWETLVDGAADVSGLRSVEVDDEGIVRLRAPGDRSRLATLWGLLSRRRY